jgi:hypothetical protein
MPDNVYAVMSKPPEGVSWEEYNAWYDLHQRENSRTPYFTGVQRYQIEPVVVGTGVGSKRSAVDPAAIRYEHLALFTFRGEIKDVRAHLNSRVEAGDIVLPPWFMDVPFSTWSCKPLGERHIPDHAKGE